MNLNRREVLAAGVGSLVGAAALTEAADKHSRQEWIETSEVKETLKRIEKQLSPNHGVITIEIPEWDFTTSIGDTIREKYRTLILHLFYHGQNDNFGFTTKEEDQEIVLLTSPEVSSIFEVSSESFTPIYKTIKTQQCHHNFTQDVMVAGIVDVLGLKVYLAKKEFADNDHNIYLHVGSNIRVPNTDIEKPIVLRCKIENLVI